MKSESALRATGEWTWLLPFNALLRAMHPIPGAVPLAGFRDLLHLTGLRWGSSVALLILSRLLRQAAVNRNAAQQDAVAKAPQSLSSDLW